MLTIIAPPQDIQWGIALTPTDELGLLFVAELGKLTYLYCKEQMCEYSLN